MREVIKRPRGEKEIAERERERETEVGLRARDS